MQRKIRAEQSRSAQSSADQTIGVARPDTMRRDEKISKEKNRIREKTGRKERRGEERRSNRREKRRRYGRRDDERTIEERGG